ncbi:MAG TPA: YncE family protein [Terriglobales bacterium]|nr:YncE family protein [Terriglobales bacterium]
MNSYRGAGQAATVLLILLVTGCGETFRPIATPIPQPGGDPSATRLALVVNQNGAAVGSVSHYNAAGDTASAQRDVGTGPVHAALLPPSGARAYVVNRDSDSVSTYLTFLAGATVRTLSLPPGSAPVYAHSNVNNRMYVAESGTDRVGVIDVTTDVLVAEIALPAGSTPVALAGTPNGAKLYSVNANGTVTVIANVDNSILGTITVGNAPIAGAMSSDGARLYVLNQADQTVSVILTSTDTVAATIPVGATPSFLRFDPRLLRVYVANTGSNSVSIINADAASPNFLTVTVVPLDTNLPAGAATGLAPVSIAPLPDGTRVYVANRDSNNVTVINASSNTVARTVAVGTRPVSLDAASDSTKVFVANQGSQTISDIQTSNDTVVQTFMAPKVDPLCTDTSSVTCPRQTPVFVLTTP